MERVIEERLEDLANRLRLEGQIYGPERDLMVDAAQLIRDLRAETVSRGPLHIAHDGS